MSWDSSRECRMGRASAYTLQFGEINSISADRVGGKALNLARLDWDLKLRVPVAFVVTTDAYRQFLEAEGLAGKLRTILAPARPDAPDDFKRRCEMAQEPGPRGNGPAGRGGGDSRRIPGRRLPAG